MRMLVIESGFDGVKTYQAGIVDVEHEHAKNIFVLNHGAPVDANDEPMLFDAACATLRLNTDEMARATKTRGK